MDSISLKAVIGEFVGTLAQSAALTALLYNKSAKHDMVLLASAIVISMVIFYHWTDVRLNPMISLGKTLTEDNPDWIRLLTDLLAQIAGGISGVYLAGKLLNFKVTSNPTEEAYVTANRVRTVITDAIFTFALVMSFMVLTVDFTQGLMVGIGIALVYVASLSFGASKSGGNINYANRVGIAIATRNFTNLFVYTVGPLIGAIIAVFTWYLYKNKFADLFAGCEGSTYVKEAVHMDYTQHHEYPLTDSQIPEVGHAHAYSPRTGNSLGLPDESVCCRSTFQTQTQLGLKAPVTSKTRMSTCASNSTSPHWEASAHFCLEHFAER